MNATQVQAMNDELIALGRRAVACKGWRWMAGMRVLPDEADPGLVYAVRGPNVDEEDPTFPPWFSVSIILDDGQFPETDTFYSPSDDGSGGIPDFSDPATLGCLLALVREAWSAEQDYFGFCAMPNSTDGREIISWSVVANAYWFAYGGWHDDIPTMARGASEAEALVAALEAAPEKA